MTHNPSNPNCDKSQYGDASGVRCTCDVDDADVPPPSTIVRAAETFTQHPTQAGSVVLHGRRAQTHAELEAATREYRAAQQLLKPAEERWRRAMDAHMEAILQP